MNTKKKKKYWNERFCQTFNMLVQFYFYLLINTRYRDVSIQVNLSHVIVYDMIIY
jgi:hypothetical protein